jgi:hypothetical protein
VRITPSKRTIRKGLTVVLVAMASLVLTIGPAGAITFGQPDGNRHPNVGRCWLTGTRTARARTSSALAP